MNKLTVGKNSLDEEIKKKPQVSQGKWIFLIVLCALTILGNLVLIKKSVNNYGGYDDFEDYVHPAAPDEWSEEFKEALKSGDQDEITAHTYYRYEQIARSAKIAFWIEVISCLGTIIAAIIMLFRRGWGYWLYLLFSLIYIAQLIWFWWYIYFYEMNFFHGIMLFIYIVFPVAFIVMYSTLAGKIDAMRT